MSRPGGLLPLSRPALTVATASSCGVVCAAALGAVTAPVVVAALCAAGVTAVLSMRASRPETGRALFAPLPVGQAPTVVVVAAPRAGTVDAGETSHPDAA